MHRCARHYFPEGRGQFIAHEIQGGFIAQLAPAPAQTRDAGGSTT
jgi:hypothetical protein